MTKQTKSPTDSGDRPVLKREELRKRVSELIDVYEREEVDWSINELSERIITVVERQ
jgi:ribosome-binding protein aMBF1 (putative translation factor)|tara:strand:- start:708 stop:878 length:171 start_codon:yes stop_codon:yes gene_type:complete